MDKGQVGWFDDDRLIEKIVSCGHCTIGMYKSQKILKIKRETERNKEIKMLVSDELLEWIDIIKYVQHENQDSKCFKNEYY